MPIKTAKGVRTHFQFRKKQATIQLYLVVRTNPNRWKNTDPKVRACYILTKSDPYLSKIQLRKKNRLGKDKKSQHCMLFVRK